MIQGWVLYIDSESEFRFEHRQGTNSFSSTATEDWGLLSDCVIILVLQNSQWVGAWLEGERVES